MREDNTYGYQVGLLEAIRKGIREGIATGAFKDDSCIELDKLVDLGNRDVSVILASLDGYVGAAVPPELPLKYKLVADTVANKLYLQMPPA